MKERPILFGAEMVRALLRDRDPKTQTRRVVKTQPPAEAKSAVGFVTPGNEGWWVWTRGDALLSHVDCPEFRCPYGVPGDRLWVRETWGPCEGGFCYRASENEHAVPDDGRWHPSIHMFREASRITLEITDIRVQRVQEIREKDCEAEGCPPLATFWNVGDEGMERAWYRKLWNSINAKRGYGWDTNPWVWALTFRRLP